MGTDFQLLSFCVLRIEANITTSFIPSCSVSCHLSIYVPVFPNNLWRSEWIFLSWGFVCTAPCISCHFFTLVICHGESQCFRVEGPCQRAVVEERKAHHLHQYRVQICRAIEQPGKVFMLLQSFLISFVFCSFCSVISVLSPFLKNFLLCFNNSD